MPRHSPPGGTTAAHSRPKASCTAPTQRGGVCRAFALPGGARCAVHEPTRQAQVQAARAKGGQVKAIRGRRAKLDTVPALVKFTAGLIGDLLDGTRPLGVARVALYGISIQRQLVEASTIEARLAAVEARLAADGPPGRARWSA